MIYLKSILAGIGAFVATVTAFSAAVTVLITRYPQIAVRMLPLQRHDLGWALFILWTFLFDPSRLPAWWPSDSPSRGWVRRASGRV
jgi:hypothetical protein